MQFPTQSKAKNRRVMVRTVKWFAIFIGGLFTVVAIGVIVAIAKDDKASTLPKGIPPDLQDVFSTAWPKVQSACPGLRLYETDLTLVGIEDNRPYAPLVAHRISIKYKVSDAPKAIPENFIAHGHTCFVEVTPDGKTLSISKDPCVAVCRGTSVGSGEDFTRPL